MLTDFNLIQKEFGLVSRPLKSINCMSLQSQVENFPLSFLHFIQVQRRPVWYSPKLQSRGAAGIRQPEGLWSLPVGKTIIPMGNASAKTEIPAWKDPVGWHFPAHPSTSSTTFCHNGNVHTAMCGNEHVNCG